MDLRKGMTITVTAVYAEAPAGTLSERIGAMAAVLKDAEYKYGDLNAQLDTRPDNSFQPYYDKRCLQPSPTSHGVCYATRGHAGDHKPWAGESRCYYPSWPNLDDGLAPHAPHHDTQCGQRNPSRGVVCTAERGHAGRHVPYWSDTGHGDPWY